MQIRKFKNNRRNKKSNKDSPSKLYDTQLNEVDVRVIDFVYGTIPDAANTAFDLYNAMSSVSDYTALRADYGEFKWINVTYSFFPLMVYSATKTDYAAGAFALRQGVFEAVPAAKVEGDVLALPGSIQVNNHIRYSYNSKIMHENFCSTSLTNTVVSALPKVTAYFGWNVVATTNQSNGPLRIRVVMHCRAKIQ